MTLQRGHSRTGYSWGAVALLALGCASAPSSETETAPDAAVVAAAESPAVPTELSSPAPVAAPPDTTDVARELDFDSLVAEIRADAMVEGERPVLPFGLAWTPRDAEEGSALAIRVLQPRGGREPVAIEATFADGVVRFGRLGESWLGMAAVPIGTSGSLPLELVVRFRDGTVHRQTASIEARARAWDRTTLRVAPRYSSPPPEVQDRIARDRRQIRAVLDRTSSEWLLDGPFAAPRPFDVTAEYGQERVFNDELQSRHTGLDLRGGVGEPVRAAGRGRVVLAGDFYFSGNGVFVDHGLGVYTGYFHLSEILVTEGQMLETGDLLGRVGATGRVTGPHLHWSLWIGGIGQDAGSLLEMDIPLP